MTEAAADAGPAPAGTAATGSISAEVGVAYAMGRADAVREMDSDAASQEAPLDRILSGPWLFRLPGMPGLKSG